MNNTRQTCIAYISLLWVRGDATMVTTAKLTLLVPSILHHSTISSSSISFVTCGEPHTIDLFGHGANEYDNKSTPDIYDPRRRSRKIPSHHPLPPPSYNECDDIGNDVTHMQHKQKIIFDFPIRLLCVVVVVVVALRTHSKCNYTCVSATACAQ